MSEPASTPLAIAPQDGLAIENPTGGVMTFKVRSEDSDGALTAGEAVSAPGEGPPLHVHPEQDEVIYTLEGRFRVMLGDDLIEAPPGSLVYIPRGTPHTWQNVDEGPARFVFTLAPGAPPFEDFFMRYAELPAEERDLEAFRRLTRETQAFEVIGPPLALSHPS